MKRVISVFVVSALLFVACNKKEPQPLGTAVTFPQDLPPACEKELIAGKPVKAGETGMELPVGSRICIPPGQREVRVQLPDGFAFLSPDENLAERTLPVYATYACYCSKAGSTCSVFFAEGMGLGCLHNSCTGSCTGKFTYKGYELDRVINLADKESFFSAPDVQEKIRRLTRDVSPLEAFGKFSVMGISFYLVQDEKHFLANAVCDCEGARACKLRTISIPAQQGEISAKKIYYCEGACNGCELTV